MRGADAGRGGVLERGEAHVRPGEHRRRAWREATRLPDGGGQDRAESAEGGVSAPGTCDSMIREYEWIFWHAAEDGGVVVVENW